MDDATYQRLLGFGLNYVSLRPRSEKEIRDYVQKKITRWAVSSDLLERVMERLRELGYVDDLKFAHAFVSSCNQSRPKGAMLLRIELRKKGIDRDCIEEALVEADPDTVVSEVDLAQKAAVKKLRGLERYDQRQQRNKLYAFLARRGFSHDIVSSVIDGLLSKGLQ